MKRAFARMEKRCTSTAWMMAKIISKSTRWIAKLGMNCNITCFCSLTSFARTKRASIHKHSHPSWVRNSENIMTACSFSCCFTLKDLVILIPKTTSGTFTQCTVHLMTRIAFRPSNSVLTYVAWLVHYQSFRYKREDEADDTSFHFVGYATLYPFFCWPDKIRMRIRYG